LLSRRVERREYVLYHRLRQQEGSYRFRHRPAGIAGGTPRQGPSAAVILHSVDPHGAVTA
jgi:hypothetical protein